jgi:hypothetical protein
MRMSPRRELDNAGLKSSDAGLTMPFAAVALAGSVRLRPCLLSPPLRTTIPLSDV